MSSFRDFAWAWHLLSAGTEATRALGITLCIDIELAGHMTILRGHFTPIRIDLIACDGDDGWVEGTLAAIHDTLRAPGPPAVNDDCEYCRYAARWAGA